jgi:FKBP-type peptidyl-prolyl cis-trans isomerase
VLAALASAVSCNAPTQPPPSIAQTTFVSGPGEPTINLSAMTVLVDTITKDSLYYQDLSIGTGEVVKPGTLITVEYTAWLPDGTEFDASATHESINTQFMTDAGQAEGTFELVGWMDGIPGMRNGGTRLFIFPPGLAFGGSSFGVVPSNSIVVYKITVSSAG